MPIIVDDTYDPYIEVKFEGIVAEHELRRFFVFRESQFREQKKTTLLIDATSVEVPEHHIRHLYTDWVKEHKEDFSLYVAGSAVVVKSAAIHFVISSLLALQSAPSPTKVFQDRNKARTWLRKCLHPS